MEVLATTRLHPACGRLLILVATGLSAIGCGAEGGAHVSGRLHVGGRPITNGSVSFSAKGLPGGYARLNGDGSFSVVGQDGSDSIAPGAYSVVVVVNRAVVGKAASAPLDVPLSVTNQATTPLRFEIRQGPNQLDIDLGQIAEAKQE